MADRIPVLIVGAGPCGLVAACLLRRRGIDVRVVEAEAEAGTGSRAVLLWPPTLGLFDEIGAMSEARSRGVGVSALSFHSEGATPIDVPLGEENAALLLPQEVNVAVLEAALVKLGGTVERRTEVIKVEPGPDGVAVIARRADGTELELVADWVIGADGSHSTVRQQLGIEFPGETYPGKFVLAEGRIEGDFRRDHLHYHLRRAGVLVVAPLPGGRARIAGFVDADTVGETLDSSTVQRILDTRGPGGLRFTDVDTRTVFQAHEKVATALRKGRCFLVGDAAHVNSPAGGQGLNLGLQDVHNLVWKLVGVIAGRLDPVVLDTYEPERFAAIQQTVLATRRLTKQGMLGPAGVKVRNALWRLLRATGVLERQYAPAMAGWRSNYPDVLFGARAGKDKLAGRRTAHWRPADTGRFRLLTRGADAGARGAELAGAHPDLVEHEEVRRGRPGFLLIRPDGYAGASGGPEDLPALARSISTITTGT